MSHMPFRVGDVVTNNEMRAAYRVGNMGGMRKSNTYNCLVLISDHTKGLYDDKWYGDELHYTGMGKVGDQVLNGNQNGTLYYSGTNGVEVHLFEVLDPGKYTYRGIVELAGEPYQEVQSDDNGNSRKVWMFPLKAIAGAPVVSAEEFQTIQERKRAQAEGMNLVSLAKAARANSTDKPGTRTVSSIACVRDPFVSEYAKRVANGKCALCQQIAPFKDQKGRPYLETHHVVWLSNGGADSIDNTVALCPNCHRKMHIVNDRTDVAILKNIAKNNAL